MDKIHQCIDTDVFAEQNKSSCESENKFIENLQSNLAINSSSSCTLKNRGMHNNDERLQSFPDIVKLGVLMQKSSSEISDNGNKTENFLINVSSTLTNQSKSIKQEIKQENLDDSDVCNSSVTVENVSVLNNSEQNSEENYKALENTTCLSPNILRVVNDMPLSTINRSENKEIQSFTDGNRTHDCFSMTSETNCEPKTSNIYNNSLLAPSISETLINPSYNYSEAVEENCIVPINEKQVFKETEIAKKETTDLDEFRNNFCLSNFWNNCASDHMPSQSVSANKQLLDPECSLSSNLVFRCRSPENSTTELKLNAQLNSSEDSRHLFKRPWLNMDFNKADVIECLEYMYSTYNFKNTNELFSLDKSKITQKSIYVTERNQQILGNRTAEKSENYADIKSKNKVPAGSCSSQKSSENISGNLPSPSADQTEISCEQLRNIVSNALKLPEECDLNSPESSTITILPSTGITSALDSSFLSSSDYFSKMDATGEEHVKSDLIVNNAESRSKSTEDIHLPSDLSKSTVHCFQAENLRNVISEYSVPLNSVSRQSKTYEHEESPDSRKRESAGVIEKIETFKKIKTENFRDDCGDLNIQPVADKETQDVQKKLELKTPNFFSISSQDLEKSQITSPKVTNVIVNINDTTENISLLFGTSSEGNMVTNSYPNAALSYNTKSAFEKPIVTDISETRKPVSALQPDCSLRTTQISSNVKRKLSPEDYMNPLTGSGEKLRVSSKKYFKREPSEILADPCMQESLVRVPSIGKNSSGQNESFMLTSSSTLIRPHIPTTTAFLKNKMYITVSRNATSSTFSRMVSCIPPTSNNSSKDQASSSTASDNSLVLPTHFYPSLQNTIPQASQSAISPSTFQKHSKVSSDMLEQKGLLHVKEIIDLGQQDVGESVKQTGYELAHYSEEVTCLDTFPGRRGNAALTKKLHKNLGARFVPTNEVLFLLLEWNASWLQIQKKIKRCPPICDKYGEVKDNYESAKEYYNMYFPLYLLSIWLKIYDSWEVNLNATHYKVRFECYEERPNYVKITCSSTLTNAEFSNFSSDEIILVTVTKCDGKEEKLFGYIYSLSDNSPPPHCNQGSSSKVDFKKILISFYTAEKPKIATKKYATIQKLCNIRIFLKQNDALVSLKTSEMKGLVLKPKDHASEISIIALPGTHDVMKMFSCLDEITDCIMSPGKKITLVDAPSSVDRVCVIVELVRKLKDRHCTVLICLKEREIFVRLAGFLRNEFPNLVIAVKASEIQMPERLKKHTLRELTKEKVSDKCTPESASSEVLKNCSVILTVLSCICFSDVGTVFPASNLTCIVDDANLFPETETILLLSYNLKNLVLFGDPRKQAELHPLLQKYGYNKSFYNRLHKVKSIL